MMLKNVVKNHRRYEKDYELVRGETTTRKVTIFGIPIYNKVYEYTNECKDKDDNDKKVGFAK